MGNLLLYLLYGLVMGFSTFSPISASAHEALFPLLLKFDSSRPLLSLFVHVGALGALVLLFWQQISHLYLEMRMAALPPKRRKRPPDVEAILQCRFVLTAAIPALLCVFLSGVFLGGETGLLPLAIVLILSGMAIYIPDYLPGGDRKARAMSPLEGFLMGLCAGCSFIPGFSAVGLMLMLALLRKCDRGYALNVAVLIVGFMLCGSIVVDLFRLLLSGFSGLSMSYFLGCLLAAAASFGGGIGAILTMRFLAVKTGFSGFAFYSWGLGLFSFILYLMV